MTAPVWQTAGQQARLMIRAALVGPTGSGKTRICSTFPNPKFIFPLNEDSKTTIMGTGLPFTEVGSTNEMIAALQSLVAANAAGHFRGEEHTVCAESFSHYSELVEAEFTRGGATDLDWSKYNAHFKQVRDLLWSLTDCHVVVSMLDHVKTDRKGNMTSHEPKLVGRAATTFVSSCTLLAFCDQEPPTPFRNHPQWVAHTQQAGAFSARTRIPGMPPGIHPNFNFYEHIAPYLPQYQQRPSAA